MKKTFYYLFFLLILFIFNLNVKATNRINSIDMNIYIDEYGDASVKEVWNTYLDSGTEGYRSFSKLGNQKITNFKVYDDKGYTYKYKSYWNTRLSFNEKAYKNGINYTTDGLELCWGISVYGNRTYTLNYKINNFVTEYTDTEGIYINLLNLDQNVGNVKVTINSYNGLNINNSKIWGFGYDGNINFNNNKVVMNSKHLSSSEYMVLLMRFEDNYFNTNNLSKKSFDEVYEEAMKGVEKKNRALDFISSLNPYVLIFLLIVASIILKYLFAFVLALLSSFFNNLFPNNNYEFEYSIKKLKKNKNINYYRDIPCNKDIDLAYFILNKLNIVKTKELKKGIIGCYILKWLYLGYINIDKEKNLIINKDIYSSLHKKELCLDSSSESKLYMILYQASGDNILNPKEFKRWSKKCYKILNKWYCDLLTNKRDEIEDKSLITNSYKKSLFGKIYYKEFGDYLMNEAYNLIGLKKFLLDFSRIKDRGLVEVELWEYYLMYATLLGISDKIDEDLKEMYPDLNIEEYIRYTEILKMIDDYSSSSYRGMKTSINNHNFQQKYTSILDNMYSGSDNYSGGGGSSFSSGGSSSGGSSGGGFR